MLPQSSRPLLGGEVFEGIETQGPIELLLVDPAKALDLPVVLRGPRLDELALDAVPRAKEGERGL